MSRCRALLSLVLVLSVCPQVARAAQTNPYFKSNANSGDMVDISAWTNPTGEVGVTFVGNAASGGFAGIFTVPSRGGSLITLSGSNFGARPAGPIVSDGTSIAFRGLDQPGGNPGLYSMPVSGGVIITVRGSGLTDPSFAPSMSPNGNIAFKDLRPTGNMADIFAQARDGERLTINGANFSRLGRPAVNTALTVAFAGSDLGSNLPKIYVQTAPNTEPLVVPVAPNLRIANDRVSIIQTPQGSSVAFQAIDQVSGLLGLFHSDQFTPQGLFSPPQLISGGSSAALMAEGFSGNSQGEYLSKKGYDYYKAKSDMGSALLPGEEVRLIGIGDIVDGSAITDIRMFESSMLENGDAMLHLTLANGSSGLYTVSVPEPTTFAIGAILPALLIRRQRTVA